MSYLNINIRHNEATLCEEISFTKAGEYSYTLGSVITLSDSRLSRNREFIVKNVNYEEDGTGGLTTTVSGFSLEYLYTRKAPNYDLCFITLSQSDIDEYKEAGRNMDAKYYIRGGNYYGVGGWKMHSIVNKLATFMGLSVEINLPNFWVKEHTISIGSTFFEGITSLISVFEPILLISGNKLYILERGGAGTLNAGYINTGGRQTTRSIDREHKPVPGCIRVEGQEGRYIAAKDPSSTFAYYAGGLSTTKTYSGTVIAPDGSKEIYSITEKYVDTSAQDSVLTRREQTSRLTDNTGYTSYIEVINDITYTRGSIIEKEVETCKAEIGEELVTYNEVSTVYDHDYSYNLKSQTTSKKELFIEDWSDYSYVLYDPRDYDIADLADTEKKVLITSEIRTTRYTEIDSETYGVDTVVAAKRYNTDSEEWQTLYSFEHDIVESGGQQRNTSATAGTLDTMQVYSDHGGCPEYPSGFAVKDEPVAVFSIPTPDWNDVNNCYSYFSALVDYEFQNGNAVVPIVDPLPLMAVSGLGSIIESGIVYKNYITGYSIDIDSESGYTTNLDLEARRA